MATGPAAVPLATDATPIEDLAVARQWPGSGQAVARQWPGNVPLAASARLKTRPSEAGPRGAPGAPYDPLRKGPVT